MNIKDVLLLLLEALFDTELVFFGYPVNLGFLAIAVFFLIKFLQHLYLKFEERVVVKVLEKIQH